MLFLLYINFAKLENGVQFNIDSIQIYFLVMNIRSFYCLDKYTGPWMFLSYFTELCNVEEMYRIFHDEMKT
jgi:hypothetical protein